MNTNDHEIIDRNGKRVTRGNGVLQDGDKLVTRMQFMDAADPRLVAAAALADSVRRNEQFDARGHRPGYATQSHDAATTTAIDKALDDRNTRLTNAWKTPPSATAVDSAITASEKVAVVGPTADNATLFAARDKVVADRDKRTSEAWRS